MPHIPVLLQEVITLTEPRPGEFVIDGTVGGGGHAKAFADAVGSGGRLLCVDRDPEALAIAKRALGAAKPKTLFERASYADIPAILKRKKLGRAAILLLDLGFSSFQIDDLERGFSLRGGGGAPLDMRYDRTTGRTAADEVNKLSERELADIIFRYGGEQYARQIAHSIVVHRKRRKFTAVPELVRVIEEALPPSRRRGKIHCATKTFQALRVHVNREFEQLERAMENLPEVLGLGGRAAVITFHSAEDRIVKRAFRGYAEKGIAALVTKKPTVPSRGEVQKNPRARSAKLRVLRFL